MTKRVGITMEKKLLFCDFSPCTYVQVTFEDKAREYCSKCNCDL